MILYEFTFSDNTDMSESEILSLINSQVLSEEAVLQDWDSGYTLSQVGDIKHLGNNERIVHFQVIGTYI